MKDFLGRELSAGFYVAFTDPSGDMKLGKVIALLKGGGYVKLRRIDDQSLDDIMIHSLKCIVVDYDRVPQAWLS